MKKMSVNLLLLFFMFSMLLYSCRNNREVPLIGIGANGIERIEYLPYAGYTKESAETINDLSSHTIETLNYVEKRNGEQITTPPWELKSFVLGLTIVAGVGLTHVGLEGQGAVYLFFDKK